ncbi:IclR family transcriptional regulator [Ahrensia sp. 13_GOM-1096m]|uniref:IclR family transcriptional regulator n=1 Tax=Ahrensia sp. 13_GOM-1096m TaxID=1380380 RepID=UPI0004799392|nr:helix-turn-helix domain-containing protein [Ahrensia sp. 13_GOM-1096m]
MNLIHKPQQASATKDSAQYSAPALSKGLRVLEYLSDCGGPSTTQEIAKELNVTRNEIFRVIAVLEMEGYLLKAGTPQGYVISGRLLELGLKEPQINDIFEVVSPLADNLTKTTGVPCQLVFASRDEMIVIRRWEPKDRLSISVPVGSRRDLEVTASGIAMLCSMSAEELSRTSDEIQKRNPSFSQDELSTYRSDLQIHGYLKFNSRLMDSVIDVSAPLVSKSGQVIGALTVPYTNNATCECTITEIGCMLSEISKHVSRQLIRS